MDISFRIDGINVNGIQKKGFTIDRPQGIKDYVFIHFTSTVEMMQNGIVFTVHPNNCIIFTPYHPQWYASLNNEFSNNWFHFTGENVNQVFELFDIPLNEVINVENWEFIPVIIKEIMKEFYTKDYYWNEHINSLLLKLFASTGRSLHRRTKQYTPYKTTMLEIFKKIRIDMLNRLNLYWTVKIAANIANVSESRFLVLYKEFFGISPITELLSARIEKAKLLLTNYNFGMNEIAETVGFNDVCYFTKQFKKMVGCTPGEYRKI
jgi:AraC family transcriptional regulator of arabinose operon